MAFLIVVLVRPALPTVLLNERDIPLAGLSSPIRFELLNPAVFSDFYRFAANLLMFVFCVFAKRFPALASQSC